MAGVSSRPGKSFLSLPIVSFRKREKKEFYLKKGRWIEKEIPSHTRPKLLYTYPLLSCVTFLCQFDYTNPSHGLAILLNTFCRLV